MADEYDRRMQELIEDDEGNQYTPEQVRAAGEALARDERGEGSFGGLEEANEIDDPNADVDALVAAETGKAPAPTRELNPMNFGKFFKDNIFSGTLGTGYVTGKRPMNLVDYASDVAIGYSGGDLGKRNAALRAGASKDQLSPLKAAEAGQNIKTGRAREEQAGAQTKKARVETEKITGDLVQQMMNDLDSDLWAGELKALAKEHGVNMRPGLITMTERMAQAMGEAGVKHPEEVLSNPESFDPRLVNRVRHTMRMLSKTVDESQAASTAEEEKRSAIGIKEAQERTRKGEETGVEDAVFQIQRELQNLPEDDPRRSQLEAQIAAVTSGGTAREDVMKARAGVATPGGGRGGEQWRSYMTRAREQLGPDASEGEVSARAEELKNMGAADAATRVSDAKALAEKSRSVAVGLGELAQMKTEMAGTGMGQEGFLGGLKSRGKAALNTVTDMPSVRTVDAVNANLTNISRSLGGQKGVLSDVDTRIIQEGLGFRPAAGDTMKAWLRRVDTFENIAEAGLREMQEATKEGREPRRIGLSESERKMFGAVGGSGAGSAGGNKTAEADAIRAEQDPARKKQMAAEYVRKYGGAR